MNIFLVLTSLSTEFVKNNVDAYLTNIHVLIVTLHIHTHNKLYTNYK